MGKKLLISFVILFCGFTFAQRTLQSEKTIVKKKVLISKQDIISINPINNSKVLSGKLLMNVSEKNLLYNQNLKNSSNPDQFEIPKEIVAIYMDHYPSANEIAQLQSIEIKCYTNSWIPPLDNHPMGFFLAAMPVNKINQALSFAFVKKMDTAEYENYPHNNAATAAINADDMWDLGYYGTGVKVAVLDSGIDTSYAGTELPATFEKKDYSNYPTSTDNDVANTVTGHGTHVTGSVLGRGYYSAGRTDDGNGSAPFKGVAPGADLVFLKIGDDATSTASDAATIGAMQAAVNIYHADILTMSYGGWDAHHDGSASDEQTVDWVYSQGKPFFLSAGNSADDDEHYSGTVAAHDSTDFIAVTAPSGGTLTYNLVWYDGPLANDLFMKYYNSSQSELTDATQYTTTESDRGTESKYSLYDWTVTAGTYYVKVINNSDNTQDFHIYFEDLGYGSTTFNDADPYYTIGQPASADHGFAVGAFVSRYVWYPTGGGAYWFGYSPTGILAPFSSRGPRVDGLLNKPNIVAPGSAIISLRDQDVYTTPNSGWIDNDGVIGSGDANYYVMQGTSMACPIVAGAAALLLEKESGALPQNIYDAIENTGASNPYTGTLPNNSWGNGILDVLAASNSSSLPVELVSFSATSNNSSVELVWSTSTEVNNYGFNIERKIDLDNNSDWEKIGFVKGNGNSNSPKQYYFQDKNPLHGKSFYRLKQIDNDGKFEFSKSVEVTLLPNKFKLFQNYPNPFNPSTKISWQAPVSSRQTIKIFDIIGREITTLIDEEKPAGTYWVTWNAVNLPSGLYFYQLKATPVGGQAGNFISTKKLLLLK